MVDVAQVNEDLRAEHLALDKIMTAADPDQWTLSTASPGWAVQDQLAHLAYFDDTARLAITDPEGFAEATAALADALEPDSDTDVDHLTLGAYRAMKPAEVLASWRANRLALTEAAKSLGERDRVPWYGPSMGSKSFLTARLMETWAHGRDIASAVGAKQQATDRLAHIVRLGVNTRGWSYVVRGLEPPTEEVAVDLESPSGAQWSFGNPGAENRIAGPAEDFCLVVTQRIHAADTDLVVTGPYAEDWMSKAQAFAGHATSGPEATGSN